MLQLTKQWPQFRPCCQHYAGTRFEEQRQLHMPQKHKATAPGIPPRVEMNGLGEQAENDKARDLLWRPLSGPSGPRCHRRLRPAALGDVLHFNKGLEVPIYGTRLAAGAWSSTSASPDKSDVKPRNRVFKSQLYRPRRYQTAMRRVKFPFCLGSLRFAVSSSSNTT
jgi:hypothetical protein